MLPQGRAGELRGISDFKTFTLVSPVFGDEHEPNDGHIPVASAKHGDFRGCLPVDHLDLIGRPTHQIEDNASEAGFDVSAFYETLGETIASFEDEG